MLAAETKETKRKPSWCSKGEKKVTIEKNKKKSTLTLLGSVAKTLTLLRDEMLLLKRSERLCQTKGNATK